MEMRLVAGVAAAMLFATAGIQMAFTKPIHSDVGFDFLGPAMWFSFGMAALSLVLSLPRVDRPKGAADTTPSG
jgi:hypothetical protein